jgi:hypothetical protein
MNSPLFPDSSRAVRAAAATVDELFFIDDVVVPVMIVKAAVEDGSEATKLEEMVEVKASRMPCCSKRISRLKCVFGDSTGSENAFMKEDERCGK